MALIVDDHLLLDLLAGVARDWLAEEAAQSAVSTIAVRTNSPPLREASAAFHIAYRVVDAP